LRSRGKPRVAILGYHRVAEVQNDPFDLAVTPEEFDTHLAFMASRCRPVSLAQALEELDRGTAGPRSVVVTLDDGYDDTVSTALQLLQRHAIPATVFICTGNPGQPFWWDRLAAIVAGAARLPARVEVAIGSVRHELPTADRRLLLDRLAGLLRSADEPVQREVLDQLTVQVTTPLVDLPRALDESELAILASDPLIELGGHSTTHRPLAGLSAAEQLREITANRHALEVVAGRPPRYFAYPHGSFAPPTAGILREQGYLAACSSDPDVLLPGADAFALPRLWVDGNRRADFGRWITRWIG
jgi:peptidoglycan/xylan/chitin deacetylase (PgdA/CDA1 family)